ncbi:hypothetical protein RHMOL_Rhmol01G0163700 [Rhododendron molle]|uniref:Uncharacterized protein n=1 Tax=Rhododendron molle TaxID=49168 RepID=A0ACC0Q1S9_RHOML|nr:hypothetical protein RHMOL_Rhmol01G0163700 [Rhododendron molle]
MATSSFTDAVGSSSHPPCRCEYPSSDEEAIEEPEAEVVHREPEQHLSVLNVSVSVEQLVRAFLLYVLGQTLFANKDSSVHTQFLVLLQHLGSVRDFDWEHLPWLPCTAISEPVLGTRVPSLAVTIGYLRYIPFSFSFTSIPVLTFPSTELVLVNSTFQFWAFEHLLPFPTDTRHGNTNCIPRYQRWLAECRKPRSPVLSLPEWRRFLDRLTIRFDPWDGVPEDTPLTRSRILDRTRSLLEGPFYRAWYLGDRVASQWRPRAEALQFIPPPPPVSMTSTSLMFKEDLKNARIRDWAGLLLQEGDYMEYCILFMAPAVAAPLVVPVWPRAPSFVSFHSDDGEEERLALTPCTTQLYTLPAGVSQVLV